MPVFVTVYVLHIDHRPAVLGPEVLADAAFFVGGHHFVVVLADGFHPDLENVVGVGRDPGEASAVRRNLGTDTFRVAKEDLARDQRRQFGVGG